jgi:hypothetical protein
VCFPAAVILTGCAVGFLYSQYETAHRKPNTFAQLLTPNDISILGDDRVGYMGKTMHSLGKVKSSSIPNELKKLPNGSSSPSRLYLGDDKWLASGGFKGDLVRCKSNYLFDGRTKHFAVLPPLAKARKDHSLLKLANGNVLIFGGFEDDNNEKTFELMDMVHKQCTIICSSNEGRLNPTLVEIAPNKVLAVGGDAPDSTIVDLVDIDSGVCTEQGHLHKERVGAEVFRISNDSFLIVGGYNCLSEKDSGRLPPEIVRIQKH